MSELTSQITSVSIVCSTIHSATDQNKTSKLREIGALEVPWTSMELLVSAILAHSKFHGIPWNCWCQRNWRTWSSMESHGIPWNCSCHGNWRTWSSMEFHGIQWNCSCHRNWRILSSMEFHWTAGVSEIGARQVPSNSMELLVSSKLAHFKF